MSERPTSRSPDLQRLRDEGYELEVRDGALLLHHVPYLTQAGEVEYGTLLSTLTLAGDVTMRPDTHVVSFIGQMPCDHTLQPLRAIINLEQAHQVAPGLQADFQFSSKPPEGYADYHEKLAAYVAILGQGAYSRDPEATARPHTVPSTEPGPVSVFEYEETASVRAGIVEATETLKVAKVAIVGLGGTGSYILDQLAKTPIGEIHLFDGDTFKQHNAFRSPGAPSRETLELAPPKVEYFQGIYASMRRGIVAHATFIDAQTVVELSKMDFVFIALDNDAARHLIVQHLESADVSFIDVGMGLSVQEGAIGGILRATLSTPNQRAHVHDRQLLPFRPADDEDVYGENIQVADLNALNAAMAVMRWKKLVGFYVDYEGEHHSLLTLDGNHLINEHSTHAGAPH